VINTVIIAALRLVLLSARADAVDISGGTEVDRT
jgi:hypothetical protein